MKKYICDVCKKEFSQQLISPFLERHHFLFKIEVFYRPQPNAPALPGADLCWDCIIQALSERTIMDLMTGDLPDTTPPPPTAAGNE